MRYRLEELFDLQMGKTPARANLDYWNGCNKWVSISDLSGYDKYVTDTKECISDLGVTESGIKAVPKNTVIMSFKLSIGKTAITTEEVYTNEAIMAFIDKGVCEINTDYLYYLFSGMDWNKGTNKAVLGLTLNKATLSKKELDFPDLHTQNKVVKKLDSLSNVIQLQKQSLDKLDELIKSRFVEMFGDPVINSMNWLTVPLATACSSIVDCPHSTPKYTDVDTGYMCIRTSIIKKNEIRWDEVEFISEDEYYERIKRKKPQKGDIIYTREGAILGIAAIINKECNVALGQRSMLLSPNTEICLPEFLCFAMNFESFFNSVTQGTSGSASPHINVADIKKFSIIIPQIELQSKFADFVTQVEKQKATVQQSIDKLETLKKSLLQEYFG